MAVCDNNPISKACTICSQEKLITEFVLEGTRYRNQCRVCRAAQKRTLRGKESPEQKAKRSAYCKQYQESNKEAVTAYRKAYYVENFDDIKAKQKAYYEQHADKLKVRSSKWRLDNPEIKAQRNKEWADANKDKMLGYFKASKAKRRQNPRHRVHSSIGGQMRNALAARKAGRKWETIVGYSVDDLVKHLEKQFTKGITWSNYGTAWHIDHIVAQVEFELDDGDDAVRACWALSNLRPLATFANLSKGADRHYLV